MVRDLSCNPVGQFLVTYQTMPAASTLHGCVGTYSEAQCVTGSHGCCKAVRTALKRQEIIIVCTLQGATVRFFCRLQQYNRSFRSPTAFKSPKRLGGTRVYKLHQRRVHLVCISEIASRSRITQVQHHAAQNHELPRSITTTFTRRDANERFMKSSKG
jgi:hypothetical protein